ncbi:DUF72 domain-containing protein [Stutzerimonas stutzeri]|nr:DUF72 domain-containing protein [Stutzerimonas stutzeri]MBW8456070.1 DUF72 domain-containing protein [Pseudomonas sp.]AWL02254.1 DUF72 domain-containing protein [Stutzerimonas stutzeri]UNM00950.1 DUF72 domain-containing protein [Stutzerimonas stutzeri]HAG19765.1 DUF72 domain-containing protein [Pseudomonas sp.]
MPSAFLAEYCAVFNTVEGNTTLYAWPSDDKVQRWASQMPDDFRFCAKFPREISQAENLPAALDAAQAFQRLLQPLGRRVTPFWLQLPASVGPARLAELAAFIEGFAAPLAIEVRHPAFFDKGDGERALNRLLRDRGVERICLDSRALFSCRSSDPALLHAQSKKPRLPVRPVAFSDSPQLRFVGHPQLEANDPFLAPWLDKVADWIEAGKTPHVYLHTPDNHRAPELAMRFHQLLSERLPGMPALAAVRQAPQLSLLD